MISYVGQICFIGHFVVVTSNRRNLLNSRDWDVVI